MSYDTPSPEPFQPAHSAPPRNRRPWLRWVLAGAGAVVILIIVLVVVLKPGNITAHGTMQDCTGLMSAGGQVTATNSSGTVIGTGTLTTDNSKAAAKLESTYDQLQALTSQFGGSSQGMTVYDFTMTVPGGQARYGLNAGHGGTVWFTSAQMTNGPGLTLGCNS